MCFSEEASFVSAAALTVISGACIYAARHTKNYIALAMIPLFFALQQASEGVEWLVFNQRLGTSHEAQLASDVFVLIAYVVWPFWIPFSLWIAEKTPTSRAYLRILFCIGCAVAVYNGWNVPLVLKRPTYGIKAFIIMSLSTKFLFGLIFAQPLFHGLFLAYLISNGLEPSSYFQPSYRRIFIIIRLPPYGAFLGPLSVYFYDLLFDMRQKKAEHHNNVRPIIL